MNLLHGEISGQRIKDQASGSRRSKVKTFVRVGCGLLLLFVLFWVWYSVAANYDYSALAGTYVFQGTGETCTLYLYADRTFVEEINRSGQTQKSAGHWDRYGEAHVSFSSEFLKLTNEELNASGQAHGQFDKTLVRME
jgi:hypothetical protein